MRSILKIVGVTSCGFLLCLGLSRCAVSAPDEMKASQSAERIGGQAGLAAHLEKREVGAGQSAERIGGQAGLETYLETREVGAGQSAERIGGQAGLTGVVADQSVATPCGSNYTCLKDTAFQYRREAEQLNALAQLYESEAETKAGELGQDAEQVKRNHDLAMQYRSKAQEADELARRYSSQLPQ